MYVVVDCIIVDSKINRPSKSLIIIAKLVMEVSLCLNTRVTKAMLVNDV